MICSFRQYQVVLFGLIILILESAVSLKLVSLAVPAYVPLGARPHLMCLWQLGAADTLYAVQWYKDGQEFFRHVPRVQRRKTFPLLGVEVESSIISGSNISITLAAAVLETGGRYRCEVSGERPLFHTVSGHGDMNIVALPNHGPVITGIKSRYRVGDWVQVTCTSGSSLPTTQLSWYINGEPASTTAVHLTAVQDENGLQVAIGTLQFRVKEQHFRQSGLKVKCLATISPVYWRSTEENTLQEKTILDKLVGHVENRPTRADRVQASQAITISAKKDVLLIGICMLLKLLFL